MKNLLLFSFLAFIPFSCKVKVKKVEQPMKSIVRDENYSSPAEVNFKIDTVYEKNELLYLVLTYQARQQAEFDLDWNGMWIKTFPPKTTFEPVMKNYVPGKKSFHHLCVFNLDNFKGSRPFYLNIHGYKQAIFLDVVN